MNSIIKCFVLSLCFSVSIAVSTPNPEDTHTVDEENPQGIVTDEVYMYFEIDGEPAGGIVIGLFGFVVPITVDNFLTFAKGTEEGQHYKNTEIHRIVKDFVIQGGDFVERDGTGSKSSFGTRFFDDENFTLLHYGPGMLGMANLGAHTNGNQFYITLDKLRWLDGRHVVFGKVLQGMDVVRKISSLEKDEHDKPLSPVVISDCGVIEVDAPYAVDLVDPPLSKTEL